MCSSCRQDELNLAAATAKTAERVSTRRARRRRTEDAEENEDEQTDEEGVEVPRAQAVGLVRRVGEEERRAHRARLAPRREAEHRPLRHEQGAAAERRTQMGSIACLRTGEACEDPKLDVRMAAR